MKNEVIIGNSYIAEITAVSNYGCIAKILPNNCIGFIEASKFQKSTIACFEDHVFIGDHLLVTVIEIDEKQRVDLDLADI